jgi:hypothetical protein
LLHWEPEVALDDGLRQTIAYFDDLLTERGTAPHQPTIAAV